jgi:hypothetical protein
MTVKRFVIHIIILLAATTISINGLMAQEIESKQETKTFHTSGRRPRGDVSADNLCHF